MWCSGASRVFTSGRSIRPVKAPLIASHHCSGRRTAGRCPPPQHSPAAARVRYACVRPGAPPVVTTSSQSVEPRRLFETPKSPPKAPGRHALKSGSWVSSRCGKRRKPRGRALQVCPAARLLVASGGALRQSSCCARTHSRPRDMKIRIFLSPGTARSNAS
ncbi:hypothetical protein T492DRAFT_503988 [Pavlovales sp. CCMP2436]|nr:hypothetical protein T492DRAFT_503988 [Pavlovales sp. CCMP2436]